MKKAFLMMLFVFSIAIAGCGDNKPDVPEDPNADNISTEMETQGDMPEDPGEDSAEEGEAEDSTEG